MSNGTQTRQPPRKTELDLVTRWSVVVLVLTALLTLGYSIIHYAALMDETQVQLSSTLPANYRDTLKALLVSAGETCPEVCDFSAWHVTRDRTTFRVSCGIATTGDACSTVKDYRLTLTQAPQPSR